MYIKALLIGASASVMGLPAIAQTTNPPHVDMPIGAQTGKIQTEIAPAPAAPTPTGREANAVTYPSVAVPEGNKSPYLSDNVSGPTSQAPIVKSQPAPDTPESRDLYPPLSSAGRRTAAVGN